MANVAGVDGTPTGWAVVLSEGGRRSVQKIAALSEIVDGAAKLCIVAVDVPIGLLDAYQIGGRACDIEARNQLRKRASSVFPAPVRSVLDASSWEDACARSRASAPHGKAITKQAFAILPKIREVDNLVRSRPELRDIVREVHPELSFCELEGRPMDVSKRKRQGREHRKQALRRSFPDLDTILKAGQEEEHLTIEDILDATVACWSAIRLAEGRGRSIIEPVPRDSVGLLMTIWV